MATLSGPVQPPLSGGRPRKLVVLLHGVGANGDDLIALAPLLARAVPDAEFVAPNAPFHYDQAPFGFQWFSLIDRSPHTVANGVRIAAPILDSFLDSELRRLGLDDEDMALVGFSQGTMMALHVGLRRRRACAGIVGFSGAVVAPESLDAEIASYPPVLLVHGEDDEVVPFVYMDAAAAVLDAAGIGVRRLGVPNLGHGIDDHGIEAASRFLAEVLRPTL